MNSGDLDDCLRQGIPIRTLLFLKSMVLTVIWPTLTIAFIRKLISNTKGLKHGWCGDRLRSIAKQ